MGIVLPTIDLSTSLLYYNLMSTTQSNLSTEKFFAIVCAPKNRSNKVFEDGPVTLLRKTEYACNFAYYYWTYVDWFA